MAVRYFGSGGAAIERYKEIYKFGAANLVNILKGID